MSNVSKIIMWVVLGFVIGFVICLFSAPLLAGTRLGGYFWSFQPGGINEADVRR